MKLIKLYADSLTESVFTNQFSTAEVLAPNSSVAVKNLTLEFDSPQFIIDDSNNTLKFRTIATLPFYTVTLEKKQYISLDELQSEIQAKMNNIINSDLDTADRGFQWAVGRAQTILNEIKWKLTFLRHDIITLGDANTIRTNITLANSTFSKTNPTTDGSYSSWVDAYLPVNQGGWFLTNKITSGGSNIQNSNWLWCVDNNGATLGVTTRAELIDKSILCIGDNLSGKYAYKKDGLMVSSNVDIAVNDVITIYKKLNKVNYVITKSGISTTLEGDSMALLPTMGSTILKNSVHIGNDTGLIGFTEWKYNQDPRFVDPVLGKFIYLPVDAIQDIYLDINLYAQSSNVKIQFPTTGIKQLLGFRLDEYDKTAKTFSFVSDDVATINGILNGDLDIELLETNTNNYVEEYRSRRNLIMSITPSELKGALFTSGTERYILSFSEGANFLFCDINNEYPLTLSQLTVRITSNKQPLKLQGKASMLLLYQNEKQPLK
jgi:hypothetical protein